MIQKTKKPTHLSITRENYEKKTKSQEAALAFVGKFLAIGVPVASVYAITTTNSPSLGESIVHWSGLGGGLLLSQTPAKTLSSLRKFEKSYTSSDWSNWTLERANLSVPQNQSLDSNPRLWTELEGRFAAMGEPER